MYRPEDILKINEKIDTIKDEATYESKKNLNQP